MSTPAARGHADHRSHGLVWIGLLLVLTTLEQIARYVRDVLYFGITGTPFTIGKLAGGTHPLRGETRLKSGLNFAMREKLRRHGAPPFAVILP